MLDLSQQKRSHQSFELKIVVYSAVWLQRWWRKVLLHRSIRISAIAIQSSVRGWLARKQVKQITCSIYVIQVCVVFFLLPSRLDSKLVTFTGVKVYMTSLFAEMVEKGSVS